MDYSKLSLIEIRDLISKKKTTSEQVVKFFMDQCEKQKNLNAVIEVYDDVLERAREVDKKIATGVRVGVLAGVPIAIKDNILYKGKKMSCASKFLENFVAPYSSTIVTKLLAEDAIIFARTNMDEFAMGGSTENSCYGACHNAVDPSYVAGGSSGGSAAMVAAGLVPCAIGTDTGGSIRQPASFNGVVGIKPTYGTVSRYGIVAFASSLDQASPIAKTAGDCELVLSVIAGKDCHDATTIENKFVVSKTPKKFKIGICKQILEELKGTEYFDKFNAALVQVKKQFDLVEVDVPHITNSLACYYVIAPAEATSNLARFDGVKYTTRADGTTDLNSVYVKSRSEGFGAEVKRRIMLGNFVLSSGYFDAYYNKAKKVERLIKKEFSEAFKKCDAIMLPTTLGTAFKIGEKSSDPVTMYKEDLFTVPANIAGLPAISVPYASGENGLPLGMQFMANANCDSTILEIAKIFESVIREV